MSDPTSSDSPAAPLAPDAVVDGDGTATPLGGPPAASPTVTDGAVEPAVGDMPSPAKIIRIGAMVSTLRT